MRKKYCEIEAIKIHVDYSSNIVTRPRTGCRQYVANEEENTICTTQDPGMIYDWFLPSDTAYLQYGPSAGC